VERAPQPEAVFLERIHSESVTTQDRYHSLPKS
jgi:hypothetical protein